ncbi:MAG: Lipopolysaccharide biosynthesis protein, partial [Pseudonocardiales bacterium]|nr:Lipopolysaccharide biosynthesis protein [Pseudonocardiales bacterium]
MDAELGARALAFYLPQFFPIPENDEWWGPGFTEWTNVARARRLFPGHRQPILPADLGFYDLRVDATREAQADLAREYGVEGFLYWHYWFGAGKTILERPFDEVLVSGEPALPFGLAFANQSWTGAWHGAPNRIRLEQQYLGA